MEAVSVSRSGVRDQDKTDRLAPNGGSLYGLRRVIPRLCVYQQTPYIIVRKAQVVKRFSEISSKYAYDQIGYGRKGDINLPFGRGWIIPYHVKGRILFLHSLSR